MNSHLPHIRLLLMLLCLPAFAGAQITTVSLDMEDMELEEVLREIKNQTGLNYFFSHDEVPEGTRITINIENASVEESLRKCLSGLPLSYVIDSDVILIVPKPSLPVAQNQKSNELTQVIRGRVLDRETNVSLLGANIVILDTDPLIGTVSDVDGYFRLEEVPIGRYSIRVSFVGYETLVVPEIQVGSAREVVLSFSLKESSESIDEVVVRPYDKGSPRNDMAFVSGRSFSVEESQRIAGSAGDVGRMALSFAGVNTDDDASNQIVVRGNSPNAMLWRLEGIQIPIPNHFYMEGWDAGYVSMLNTNMLGPSDFFTGAFPAEYGNCTSGVFDLTFRNGNNEKRENTFEFGVLGVDLSTEGPFSKNYKGSYLVNFRYATFSLMNLMGIRIGGDVLPGYTDLSFKINLPTSKFGTLSLWGMGGKGKVEDAAVTDTAAWEENIYMRYGYETHTRMGAAGITHTIFPDNKSYLKSVLSISGNQSRDNSYRQEYDLSSTDTYHEKLANSALRFSTYYNRKITSRLSLRTGVVFSKLYYNYDSEYLNEETEPPSWYDDIYGKGDSETYQGYFQMKWELLPKFTVHAGLHYLHLTLNEDHSLEPRAGFKWDLPGSQSITGGIGLHSRHELLMHYFTRYEDENGMEYFPNKDLELQRSMQYVLGYSRMFAPDLKFQVEVYYQDQSKLPVSPDSALTWSLINDDVFGFEFVSKGLGRNYGIEFTLEKFFTNNYYFLITNSLFSAKYQPLDGKWYNSRYNNRYILNLVGGKEFRIRDKNILGLNGRFIWSGGRRYTPVDEAKLDDPDEWYVYDHKKAYSEQFSPYLRLDLGVSYKINNPRVSHEFSLDIQNVTARENKGGMYYLSEMDEVVVYTLQGILPIVNYRIHF